MFFYIHIQVGVVSEGLCAAYVLFKLDVQNTIPIKNPAIWSALVNPDKQIFFQEKFLVSATEDGTLNNNSIS